MSFSESDTEDEMEERRSPSPLLTPLLTSLDLKTTYSIARLHLYHFEDEFSKNIYVAELNALFEESRTQFHKQRIKDLESGSKLFEELNNHSNPDSLQHSTRPQEDEGAFQLVKGRKKGRSPTPPKDTSTSTKKQKTTDVETSNKYDALLVHHDEENEDATGASVNHNAVRPPPPITIDNVKLPNQLLKKLQDTTQQKLRGRMVGKGLRIYPETPEAYHAIRRYIDAEKLEAFTYQLPEEKEIKAVIRGMPADIPPQEIIEDLLTVEPLRPKLGPVQCFRCQRFFHSSKYCMRNPKCVKCGQPQITRNCTKTSATDATCCNCQGNHPANFTGCPKNPLNKPPPPPKVNFWEERARKRRELQDAAKAQADSARLLTGLANSASISTPPPTRVASASDFTPPPVSTTTSSRPRPAPTPSTSQGSTSDPNTPSQPSSITETLKQLHEDPDVVALQETFLRPSSDFNIANYATYRNDRLTHRGGGTAILVKNSIPHHSIQITTSTVELTSIVIESQPSNITICSLYNRPGPSARNLIPDLQKIFRNRSQCIIVGDYNAKHTFWSATSRNNTAGNAVARLIRTKGFLLTAPQEFQAQEGPQHSTSVSPVELTTSQLKSTRTCQTTTTLSTLSFRSIHQFPLRGVGNLSLYTDNVKLAVFDVPFLKICFMYMIEILHTIKQNCKTLTNWDKFQDIIANSLPGNPQISNREEIEEAIVNFNSQIQNAVNQASKFKPILHSMSNIPFETRLKIREKNRLRKLWQRTQYPPLKAEVNRLQRIIRADLKKSKEHVWDSLQKDANIDIDYLHKLVADNNNRNNIHYHSVSEA
ncbi:RNA-directed DNA polymerase from mobile element jockey [Trichonephila clavipes]|nr:RNA-directed DNA polymerase from mobile element jockey [Trichonephila clavipes]